MRKQLRFLSLLAVLGCAIYVFAQSRIVSSGGGSPAAGQGTVASRVPAPRNEVLGLVTHYMVAKQDEYIERANAAGKEDVVTKVILALNYNEMTLKTPEEQKRYVKDVLQIEKWNPGPAWNDVAKAPSLVHDLLIVTPEANKKAVEVWARVWDDMLKPWHEFEKKIEAQAWYQRLDESGQRSAMYQQKQKYLLTDGGLKIKAYQTDLSRKGVLEVREMLTDTQKKELDAILIRFDRDMDLAAKGIDPLADKKG